MIKLFQNLFDRATGVKSETVNLANTADKVGGLIRDVLLNGCSRFDASASYYTGQYVIYSGVLCEVVQDTNPGETPDSHGAKWSKKLVTDATQANESNTLPIATNAVVTLIAQAENLGGDVPNASETERGKARQATSGEYEAGASDVYTTPAQVKGDVNNLSQKVSSLQLNENLTFQRLLSRGGLTDIMAYFRGGLRVLLTKLLAAGSNGKAMLTGVTPDNTLVQLDQLPNKPSFTGVVVVGRETDIDFAGQADLVALAAALKPILNATTPSTGPTVANAVTDKTVTASGNQNVDIPTSTFAGADTYSATLQSGAGLPISYSTIGSIIRFVIPANFANQTLPISLIGSNANSGKSIATPFSIIINRTVGVELPYIKSIWRIFNANTGELDYLVETSYIGTEDSKKPVWRCKRAGSSTWISDFGLAFPTAQATPAFSNPLTTKYPYYAYASLQQGAEATTATIFQWKPYLTAPDNTIIDLPYTQNNSVSDTPGTEVYNYAGLFKCTGLWIKRISENRLCLYAQGSGTLTTKLIATGSTPAYSNSEKVMLTEPGGYDSPENFTGKVKYGSLYGKAGEQPVVNGSYTLIVLDDSTPARSRSYALNMNDTGPIATLIEPIIDSGGSGGGDTGGGDNTTPAAGDQSSYTATSTFTA